MYAASFFLGPYYTVHHTFEEAELAASSHRVARLLLFLERTLGRRTVARARGIICVTSEIASYELGRLPSRAERPVLIYPNGVLYSDDGDELPDMRGHQVEVVFLSSQFFGWHGLDDLLESMSRSREDVVVHLAGVVPEPLLRKASEDRRIRVHGTLDPSAVGQLIARGWVGLSSFGLAQKKMTEACTLKVREYLRAGLPVYAGHRDSALPADFPYFRQGQADLASIVAYAREMRAAPRAAVSRMARPYIDKQILLQRLYRSLERGVDPQNGPTDRPDFPGDVLPR
jgi:glycosyltransferase involved in cell wall biosynthesis